MNTFINFLYAAILAGTPLLFGTLGEIITERVGNLNLGVEGMMWIGAFAGFYAAYTTESLLLSLLAAFFSAALSAAIYALLTVTLRANQNVTGLTLTTFGTGISLVLGYAMTYKACGAPKISEHFASKVDAVSIPVLSDIPYIGKILFSLNPLTYFAILLCILFAVFYNKTRTGLSVRAIGENPAAADVAGINVTLHKYLNIIIGGGICGIGGAFMSLISANGSWQPAGIVNGCGWIAVALVIFVSWNPAMAILGSFVFGAFKSLTYYIPASVIDIPKAFYQMLPFLLTILVLIITSVRSGKKSAQPAACGLNYFREER
ncbi:MAG: ABC transporter permease [Clostridiales bacterium]|nr:ABC transporter permease [Clostridiales bacterium]